MQIGCSFQEMEVLLLVIPPPLSWQRMLAGIACKHCLQFPFWQPLGLFCLSNKKCLPRPPPAPAPCLATPPARQSSLIILVHLQDVICMIWEARGDCGGLRPEGGAQPGSPRIRLMGYATT